MKILLCAALLAASFPVLADTRADGHAPIGVMGDHLHKKGSYMLSYRFMRMSMADNRDGDDSLSPEAIVTSVPNRFANPPMMPPTLRVVPLEMTMDMHMFGGMIGLTDRITLMGMTSLIDKSMDHVTFQGPAGTTRLGNFSTSTQGIGDTSVTALVHLASFDRHQWHAQLGLSLPTGSTDETAVVLTPMNTRPELRAPYPMQLGSGTYDLIVGATYNGRGERLSWGGQWSSKYRLGDNDEGYALGDEHNLTGWLALPLRDTLSVAARISFADRGNVSGIDPLIMAPVQTADPDRLGGQRLELGLSTNVVIPGTEHRLALELSAPVVQDLDGPQLETDWTATVGWQYAF